MPANGFNIGKDVRVDITSGGAPLRPTIVTAFQSRQETKSVQSDGLSGDCLYDELPCGWSGSFEYDRADSVLDDYFAQREANYYAGAVAPGVTITETIQEVNGSISQYRYTGVALKFDAGEKKAESPVKQKLEFKASKRVKV